MLYETFHLLKEYADSHPENLQNITEKGLRQRKNSQHLMPLNKTGISHSSLPENWGFYAVSR